MGWNDMYNTLFLFWGRVTLAMSNGSRIEMTINRGWPAELVTGRYQARCKSGYVMASTGHALLHSGEVIRLEFRPTCSPIHQHPAFLQRNSPPIALIPNLAPVCQCRLRSAVQVAEAHMLAVKQINA